MQKCGYCGGENPDGLKRCGGCGEKLEAPAVPRQVERAAPAGGFFQRRVASMVILVPVVLYGVTAVLNLVFGIDYLHRDDTRRSGFFFRGLFWNGFVVVACLIGRRLIRSSAAVDLLAGALFVAGALLVVIWQSRWEFRHGMDLSVRLEIVSIWLPMLYVIIYAWQASRVHRNPTL